MGKKADETLFSIVCLKVAFKDRRGFLKRIEKHFSKEKTVAEKTVEEIRGLMG